ncbi:MAG: class A beta-lactamase-related serine hydrolase [Candidatus Thorarchaeota archaeon]|nr:class A beta-lactamase-related serine hydrolase [Candidatus Thorarchaeota archaeon]
MNRMNERFDTKELAALLVDLSKKDEFSGVVLIAKDHQEVFKEAYGYASIRYNIPNRTDTRFNLGSINKIFTRTAIQQLAEKGKLHPDDHVGRFLPDFPEAIAAKVTINHLLTFTSGLGHYWNDRFIMSMANLRSIDDFIALFIDDPLSFEPGTQEQYSNSGYVVLGMTMIAGGAPGVSAFLINYIDQGYTAIILSNYDPEDAQVVERRITDYMKSIRG